MSSLSKRINKKIGAIYVYHVESYWDKEKKAPRNKQTYLSKEDPETGEIISTSRRKPRAGKKTVASKGPACFSVPEESTTTSKAVPGEDICAPSDPVNPPVVAKTVPGEGGVATSRVAGPWLAISKAAEDTGLSACVKQVFPDLHLAMMSLVCFCVQKGLALSRSEFWSQGHLHPAGTPFSSQHISELLLKITEDDRQRFFSLWLKHVCGKEYLYYDITSISSYATANAYVRYGYNRDGEDYDRFTRKLFKLKKNY